MQLVLVVAIRRPEWAVAVEMVALRYFLADFSGQQPRMNLDMPLPWSTISTIMGTLCRMVRTSICYRRAMPNFCPCIPTSIPLYQMEIHRRQQSNSFHRLYIQQAQKTFLSDSERAIQMDFTKCSYSLAQENHTTPPDCLK